MKVTTKATENIFLQSLTKHERGPLRLLIPVVALSISLYFTKFPPKTLGVLRDIVSMLITVSIAWAVIKVTFII